jgi:hypothetical protein
MERLKTSDIILLLLYSPDRLNLRGNREIRGITRLIKLLFLIQSELKSIGSNFEEFDYQPYKMGPFSGDVYSNLEFLESFEVPLIRSGSEGKKDGKLNLDEMRILESMNVGGQDDINVDLDADKTYSLTKEGKAVAEYLWTKTLSDSERTVFKEVANKFVKLSLNDLLRYVYEKYPKFTVNSQIKNSLYRH